MTSHKFDKDYFENGIKSGISLYENYRWMSEKTMPIAYNLKRMYPDCNILDFGCAKGFLVYGLRKLKVDAYGFDISEYAISHCEAEVKNYLYNHSAKNLPYFDLIFGKDVLEHIEIDNILNELSTIRSKCNKAFFIVPLAKNGSYIIPDYDRDITHHIRFSKKQWLRIFEYAGFKIESFDYSIKGFKDNWKQYKKGNGFFRLC